MRDHDPEAFEELAFKTIAVTTDDMVNGGYDQLMEACMRQFIEYLDAESDKKLLDKMDGLCENIIDFCRNTCQYLDKYSVVIHGDCWLNNLMFLYKDNKRKPEDVKLIDWQMMSVNSPIVDISSLFYTVATKEMMNNLEKYQKIYYNALCILIRKLGSEPEKVFPYDVFNQHWKKYSKFGLAVAFPTIKGMLYDKDEVPDTFESLADDTFNAGMFSNTIKNQDQYQTRMKDIFEHFIDNSFL